MSPTRRSRPARRSRAARAPGPGHAPSPARGPSPAPPASPRLSRRLGIAAAGLLALAAIVVLALAVGGASGAPAASATPPGVPGSGAGSSPSVAPATPSASAAASTPTTSGSRPATSDAAAAIDGVECDPAEQVAYHVHAHLDVRDDSRLLTIPATVGHAPACLYWLHTHATSGIIHVEAPAPGTFTLGQFFAVWGQPLTATQVATIGVGDRHVFAFVNGTAWTGDPAAIPLDDLAEIDLQVGSTALPPIDFTWPADFVPSGSP